MLVKTTSSLIPLPVLPLLYTNIRKRLPRYIKRMIYAYGIIGVFQKAVKDNVRIVEKLHKLMRSMPNSALIDKCDTISDIVWKGIGKKSIQLNLHLINVEDAVTPHLQEHELERLGRYFADEAPSWLVYGTKDLMVHDAICVLKEVLLAYE